MSADQKKKSDILDSSRQPAKVNFLIWSVTYSLPIYQVLSSTFIRVSGKIKCESLDSPTEEIDGPFNRRTWALSEGRRNDGNFV